MTVEIHATTSNLTVTVTAVGETALDDAYRAAGAAIATAPDTTPQEATRCPRSPN